MSVVPVMDVARVFPCYFLGITDKVLGWLLIRRLELVPKILSRERLHCLHGKVAVKVATGCLSSSI